MCDRDAQTLLARRQLRFCPAQVKCQLTCLQVLVFVLSFHSANCAVGKFRQRLWPNLQVLTIFATQRRILPEVDTDGNVPRRSRHMHAKDLTMTLPLQPGDSAPDFSLPRDGGSTVAMAQLRGKKVVLYFYPKDDTSGCTLEAKNFSDLKDAFAEAGAEIVGMSADSAASHDKFKKKYDLSFTLASDEGKATLEAYGVWVEKSMYGKKYMGIERTTVLIDASGRIARVWNKVKVPGHADEVLAAVKAL
jgi:thioredoxin-dependent peroxiredoxin